MKEETENGTKNVLPEVISDLCDTIEKSNVKITFGLQPNHIKRIESEINRWDSFLKDDEDTLKKGWIKYDRDFWKKLGYEFGWEPLTLALYYFQYLEDSTLS